MDPILNILLSGLPFIKNPGAMGAWNTDFLCKNNRKSETTEM